MLQGCLEAMADLLQERKKARAGAGFLQAAWQSMITSG